MDNKHAIIIIKDKDKYLQYYEKTWESYLFINCKIVNENDYEYIKKTIKEKHDIEINRIKLIKDIIHTKYSVKNKINKEYHHYFYQVEINNKDLDDNYKYFSYKELTENKRIMEVNSDIVEYVREISE